MFDICISWLIVPLPKRYVWNVKMQYWLNEVLIIGYNYHIKPGFWLSKKDNSMVLVDDCSTRRNVQSQCYSVVQKRKNVCDSKYISQSKQTKRKL